MTEPLLVPLTTDDCPSLFDSVSKEALLADERRFDAAEEVDGWPPLLRRDFRDFVVRYLDAHGVSQRRLASALGRSTGFVSGLLKPKRSGKRFRAHTLLGGDLEVLLSLLQLPANEEELLRYLVYLEDARRRDDADQEALFKRRVEVAWKFETSYLPQDRLLRYTRDFRYVILREMVRLRGFDPSPAWLRQHLGFPFDHSSTIDEVKRGWAEVQKLGLVRREADAWVPAKEFHEVILGTGPTKVRDALIRYYRSTLDAAQGGLALDRDRRFFQARTLAVRRDALEKLQMQTFELFRAIEEAEPGQGEIVLHVGLSAFTVADVNGRPPELESAETKREVD